MIKEANPIILNLKLIYQQTTHPPTILRRIPRAHLGAIGVRRLQHRPSRDRSAIPALPPSFQTQSGRALHRADAQGRRHTVIGIQRRKRAWAGRRGVASHEVISPDGGDGRGGAGGESGGVRVAGDGGSEGGDLQAGAGARPGQDHGVVRAPGHRHVARLGVVRGVRVRRRGGKGRAGRALGGGGAFSHFLSILLLALALALVRRGSSKRGLGGGLGKGLGVPPPHFLIWTVCSTAVDGCLASSEGNGAVKAARDLGPAGRYDGALYAAGREEEGEVEVGLGPAAAAGVRPGPARHRAASALLVSQLGAVV